MQSVEMANRRAIAILQCWPN